MPALLLPVVLALGAAVEYCHGLVGRAGLQLHEERLVVRAHGAVYTAFVPVLAVVLAAHYFLDRFDGAALGEGEGGRQAVCVGACGAAQLCRVVVLDVQQAVAERAEIHGIFKIL